MKLPGYCAILLFILFSATAYAAETRTVVDMRGTEVTFPLEPSRIATIDDGFVEGVMTHLGVVDKVAAIASWGLKRDYHYTFESMLGEGFEHRGLNTMKYLHSWLDELPCFNSPQGNILNFETLAKADPELVILRVGDCSVRSGNDENIAKTIATIEELGLPLVVLYAPTYYGRSDLATMRDEMGVIGDIFGQKEKALRLADKLAETEKIIRERTGDIPEADKRKVLYIGMDSGSRQKGAAGAVFGTNTPDSYIVENIAGAINAFQGLGIGVPISTEQIYALDPDVIVLPTYNGYHPPRELYEAPYFADLAELRAIRDRRVYALPWTPMNCAKRLEYPIDLLIIAKAAYPERFGDINIYDFALNLYKELYNVDEETAKELRSTQLLDWMAEYDF